MNICTRQSFLFLAFLWLSVQSILLYTEGIGIKDEAIKYIEQANLLLHQHSLEGRKYIFYLLPVLLIALSILLKLSFAFAVIIQILINAFSTIGFYVFAKQLSNNNKAIAVTATAFLITFIPYQTWNTFLYTESIFLSLSILLFYSFTVSGNKQKLIHLIRICLLISLLLSRPLGLLYVPAVGLYYLQRTLLPYYVKIILSIAVTLVLYATFNYLYTAGNDMDILKPVKDGNIICFLPTQYADASLNLQQTNNPLNDLGYYILNNPLHFIKLAALRTVSFFNLYRNDYSLLHNIYLIIVMLLIYTGILLGLIYKASVFKHNIIRYLFLPLLLFFILGVMLQCDDYNSRFSMALFPMFILFAVNGWYVLLKRGTGK